METLLVERASVPRVVLAATVAYGQRVHTAAGRITILYTADGRIACYTKPGPLGLTGALRVACCNVYTPEQN